MSADWYPDPAGRANLRYHDGTRWTHDVVIGEQRFTEPIGYPLPRTEPGAVPTPPPPPTAPPVPYPMYAPPPTGRGMAPAGGGRLIAAGVLAIISGVVTLLGAIGALVLAADFHHLQCSGPEPWCGSFASSFSALFVVLASIIAAIAALFVVAGIGACMRKYWGQIAVMVIGICGALLQFVALVGDRGAGALIPLVWFGTIAGLAASNKRADYEEVR